MSISQIRKHRGVPAKVGGRVFYRHESRYGTIVGAYGGYIRIRLDGDKHIGLVPTTFIASDNNQSPLTWSKQ